jgi:hypothetical protein
MTTEWIELRDEASGKLYYGNKVTGVTQWEMPDELRR